VITKINITKMISDNGMRFTIKYINDIIEEKDNIVWIDIEKGGDNPIGYKKRQVINRVDVHRFPDNLGIKFFYDGGGNLFLNEDFIEKNVKYLYWSQDPADAILKKRIPIISALDPYGEEEWEDVPEKIRHNMKHVKKFVLNEEKTYNPIKDDHVMITYWLTGEPVPVKVLKVFRNNTYLVDFNVEGSTAAGAPNATIKNSDIISPYKPLKSPVGTGYISANTNMSIRQVHQVSNDMYL